MNEKMLKVTNRSNGAVCYRIPERNLSRIFHAHETKTISENELKELSSQPGGAELIYHYLLVQDAVSVREILNVDEAPEYWLTEDNIPNWMASCSLDEFKDGLDFAPLGVKDLIKKYAVSMPLNDMAKRAAIQEILKFDVTKAIEIEKAVKEDDSNDSESAKKTSNSGRRSSATTINAITNKEPAATGYKVVSRGE